MDSARRKTPPSSSVSSHGGSPPPLKKQRSDSHGKDSKSSKNDDKDKDKDDKNPKKRAARACVTCRARKVRCNVVEEHPCNNCKWDHIECVVQESRRRKKSTLYATPATSNCSSSASAAAAPAGLQAEALRPRTTASNPPQLANIASADVLRRPSIAPSRSSATPAPVVIPIASKRFEPPAAAGTVSPGCLDSHHQSHSIFPQHTTSALPDGLPHSPIWQQQQQTNPSLDPASLFKDLAGSQSLEPDLSTLDHLKPLPPFLKPLPLKIDAEDRKYLYDKGALTLPSAALQDALLRAFVEYVYPYMPLMDLQSFLEALESPDGRHGQISLLLYHAIMFVASAFVSKDDLREAGYSTRKQARKILFTKTRLLYDFDYESDRLVLVQGLLLMSYWYETPDDQKDTWHWIGVAISLSHTIGLHRNPVDTGMPAEKKTLRKRIWWSCYMRDRLIALGMRRPTRIKEEDFNVPMLEESDFEPQFILNESSSPGTPGTTRTRECPWLRNADMQHQLAQLCVAKARLSVLVGQMLKTQYSVLIRDPRRPDDTTNSTMMLFPNKTLSNMDSVQAVDEGLNDWFRALPESCRYRPLTATDGMVGGRSTVSVQRNLLHMVFYTTISALHRPQFLPASPDQQPSVSILAQEMSRVRVCESARRVTAMAAELHNLGLDRLLPTTGVTVVLPAMIIHLLEMKNSDEACRRQAARGFHQCMLVMQRFQHLYAAADFAVGFLLAALKKASIPAFPKLSSAQKSNATPFFAPGDLGGGGSPGMGLGLPQHYANAKIEKLTTPPPDNAPYLNDVELDLFHRNRSYANGDHKDHDATKGVTGGVDGATLDTLGLSGQTPPVSLEEEVRSRSGSETSETFGMTGDLDMSTMDLIDWSNVDVEGDFLQFIDYPEPAPGDVEAQVVNVLGVS